jgi:hypothetical protein
MKKLTKQPSDFGHNGATATANPTTRSYSNIVVEEKKKGIRQYHSKTEITFDETKCKPVTTFTKEMVARAHQQGILPHEMLYTIAIDNDFIFKDLMVSRGKVIEFERHATPQERMDCAKAVLPYYAPRKIDVQHSGEIKILHALAKSPLASNVSDEIIEGEIEEMDREAGEDAGVDTVGEHEV